VATNGLRSRLARLEARVTDAGIAHVARRRAGDGVAATEIEGEMRRFFRLVTLRLGPRPTPEALAALIEDEYGASAGEAYRRLRAEREKRSGR
jgi:hypothetical protein